MNKKLLVIAALALSGSAALLFLLTSSNGGASARSPFVRLNRGRFTQNGQPFRFVGANVAVMYRDEDRERMPETLKQASDAGIKVVRVWAFGEGGPNDVKPMADFADWPRSHPFRFLLTSGTKRLLFISTRSLLKRQEQDPCAAMFDELVARHGRRNSIPAGPELMMPRMTRPFGINNERRFFLLLPRRVVPIENTSTSSQLGRTQ
jgi:hypothetical protein